MQFRFGFVVIFLFLASCLQGPWEYYPEKTETYNGVYVFASVIAGRSVSGVCFERTYALNEALSEDFAFYDSASVQISGNFSGSDTAVFLTPESARPNCFDGPSDLLPQKGASYSLKAVFRWDSSGNKVISTYTAQAKIPEVFKIKAALAPNALGGHESFAEGDTVYALDYPMDLASYYFVPDYKSDTRGVLITLHYDPQTSAENPDNFLNYMLGSFIDDNIFVHDLFDSVSQLGYTENSYFGGTNLLDTLSVIGYQLIMPKSNLFFYATDSGYYKYRTSVLTSESDASIKPESNVRGGSGYFTGMAVDTISFYMKSQDGDTAAYFSYDAKGKACRDLDWDSKVCRRYLPVYCDSVNYDSSECFAPAVKAALERGSSWDSLLPSGLDSSAIKLAKTDGIKRYCIANGFPNDSNLCTLVKEDCLTSLDSNGCKLVLWKFCADRGWPLDSLPECGSALVSRYRLANLNSAVIKNVVNAWCKENSDDPQCE